MPLGTLGTTMKNTNTKLDCTTSVDQCGSHLADSAQADYCYIGRTIKLYRWGPIKTSTTLYITCIAGCQYNFIHITRILFNFANDIAGCQYNFIHITRILFNFANDIVVPNRGPKSGSQIGVPNWGPKLGSQIGVPNRGTKSGSQIGVPNRGCPKSGSQMGVSQIEVNNQGPK
jgi:hypothetical protein